MAEAEGIPPTASVASVGPGLRYVGDWAYAYSGVIAVGSAGQNVPSTLNKFTTGNGIFVGKFQWYRGTSTNTGHDYLHIVKLNGIEVLQLDDTASTVYEQESAHLVIPPYTEVDATSQNTTTGADNNIIFTFTGRVYDV